MSQNREKRKLVRLSMPSKVILGVLAVMAVILLALTIMRNNGLHLIQGEYYLIGPLLMILLLLGWGTYGLFKRFSGRGARMAIALAGSLVVLLLLNYAMNYISYFVTVAIPQRYAEIKSPDGQHTVVLMRTLDPTQERTDERRAARVAADDPEADPSGADYAETDFCYRYVAYPKGPLGLFFRSDADVEGEVFEAYGAEGRLKYDWPDENTFRLWITEPGIGEGGEWLLRF